MAAEWSLARVYEIVCAAIPDRDLVVWGDERETYGRFATRANALAAYLDAQDMRAHRERGLDAGAVFGRAICRAPLPGRAPACATARRRPGSTGDHAQLHVTGGLCPLRVSLLLRTRARAAGGL